MHVVKRTDVIKLINNIKLGDLFLTRTFKRLYMVVKINPMGNPTGHGSRNSFLCISQSGYISHWFETTLYTFRSEGLIYIPMNFDHEISSD